VKTHGNGQHDLVEIFRSHGPYDEDRVVRWCQECGAVVVDVEIDGRTAPGCSMLMRFPKNERLRGRK